VRFGLGFGFGLLLTRPAPRAQDADLAHDLDGFFLA
jgi:hypothetical protein